MNSAVAVATWWGFAEANRPLVAVAVVAVAVAAGGYLGRRWWRARRGD